MVELRAPIRAVVPAQHVLDDLRVRVDVLAIVQDELPARAPPLERPVGRDRPVAEPRVADRGVRDEVGAVRVSSMSDESTSPTLGRGEREAIALAAKMGARWLILDDFPGPRVAASHGLPVIGTVGLLLAAKRDALVSAIAPLLDQLAAAHFRLSSSLLERTPVVTSFGPWHSRTLDLIASACVPRGR